MKLLPRWLSMGLLRGQIQEVVQAAAVVPPGLSAVVLVRRPAMGKLLGCRWNGMAWAPLLAAVIRTPVQRVRPQVGYVVAKVLVILVDHRRLRAPQTLTCRGVVRSNAISY